MIAAAARSPPHDVLQARTSVVVIEANAGIEKRGTVAARTEAESSVFVSQSFMVVSDRKEVTQERGWYRQDEAGQ